MEREIVAPGDSVLLTIIFDTKTYKSLITKRPLIVTNADTLDGKYYVQIMTTVTPHPDSLSPLLVTPYKIDISQFGEPVRDSTSCTFKNITDSTLNLQLIDYPQDLMQVDLPPHMTAQQEIEWVIKLTELGVASEFEKSITFETDHPLGTRYTTPVKRAIRETVWIAPETACVSTNSAIDCP